MRAFSRLGLSLGLLQLLLLASLVPNPQRSGGIPLRDSGIALYFGQEILTGRVPYRELWEPKPPALYYLDALGLLIGSGSSFGVWLLEVAALLFAGLFCWRLLERNFGPLPALFGTTSWIVTLPLLLEGGNLTEEFALAVQFFALERYLASPSHFGSWGRPVLFGLTWAVALLLKPTLIGLWVSASLYVLFVGAPRGRQVGALVAEFSRVVLGIAVVVVPVVVYFGLQGALPMLFDQVFQYNWVARRPSLERRLDALLSGLSITAASGLSIVALVGWLLAVVGLTRRQWLDARVKPLLAVAVIALPVELLLASSVGSANRHYYLAWLPVFGVLAAFPASAFAAALSRLIGARQLRSVAVPLLGLLVAMSFTPLQKLFDEPTEPRTLANRSEAVQLLRASTAQTDYVLMWGPEVSVNFRAARKSPTRYIDPRPLYTAGYQRPEMAEELLSDLVAGAPALIIDTSRPARGVPPINSTERSEWLHSRRALPLLPQMEAVFAYIDSHYSVAGHVGPDQWVVYRRASGQAHR